MTAPLTEAEIDRMALETLQRGLQALRAIARKGAEVERLKGADSAENKRLAQAGNELLDDLRDLAACEDIDNVTFQAMWEATGARRLS
ncbi:hypothetical protein [Alloyangia pacifica]|uniref:Uncharacterized protein n=1 Tax=Alloyangia pacifica TaxID=311180 RepID=A0A1I6PQZ1_9RHOB|nr:hypothetical protein [Alloyangia pacifica]SDG33523.1 hypothetical protein SAMN04488245_102407 [Alloyangia pacifica]SFS42611.1 hypothetical protein SAMN04488050_101708 [Alloyangia pacifica]